MSEVLLTFLAAPFIAFWALLTTSWWAGTIFMVLFGTSIYKVHDDRPDGIGAFITFALAIIIVLFCSQYFGKEHTFWEAAKLSGLSILNGLKYYAIWGVVSVIILWIFEALSFKRKYRDASKAYTEQYDLNNKYPNQNKEEYEASLWRNCFIASGLKSDKPLDAKSKEGISSISSFFFIWPIHLIDKAFGELFKQIPELLSSVFGGTLNFVTQKLTGGNSGRPDQPK